MVLLNPSWSGIPKLSSVVYLPGTMPQIHPDRLGMMLGDFYEKQEVGREGSTK